MTKKSAKPKPQKAKAQKSKPKPLSKPKKIEKTTKTSSTKRLRNVSKQSTFRKKSGASRKDEKHVAHTIDLEVAKFISRLSKGREDTETLRFILNHKNNFQMSFAGINLGDHKEYAQALMEKYRTGEPLTKPEEKRARMQVKVLHKMRNVLPDGFKEASMKFYKTLRTKDGKTLIDKRIF